MENRSFENKNNIYVIADADVFVYRNDELIFVTNSNFTEKLAMQTWYKSVKGYAVTRIGGKNVYAHRFLIDAKEEDIIAPIDKDTKNCRAENLEYITHKERRVNSKSNRNNKTGVRGVTFYKEKYMATIRNNYHLKYLGLFDNLEDAADARKTAEKKLGWI